MHYLLIHGSWHGSWCWSALATLLRSRGETTEALDLPNSTQTTFADLCEVVRRAVVSAVEPVTLIASSSGSLPAAYVAEEQSERIHHIYHIAGWLPTQGQSLYDLAIGYNNSELYTIFREGEEPGRISLDPEGAKSFFYQDCPAELQQWAAQRLVSRAEAPDMEKMPPFSPDQTRRKTTYLLCEQDRAIHPDSQLDMTRRFGLDTDQVIRLSCGHIPFLSLPSKIADLVQEKALAL